MDLGRDGSNTYKQLDMNKKQVSFRAIPIRVVIESLFYCHSFAIRKQLLKRGAD